MRRRAAFILPIVLIVISLLALTMAGFVFFVRAEITGTTAHLDSQQASLAAESGLHEVIATLRLEPHNSIAWFDSPQRFRHKLIWSEAYERDRDPIAREGVRTSLFLPGQTPAQAWRFSVVADRDIEPSGLENKNMRFGITPESGKLNLNAARDEQIEALLTEVVSHLHRVDNAAELVNALLDWRDADNELRDGGAESDYYNTLEPPYNAKNGPFDSVEELLLVKGFNAAILYGEDVNRNGILDPNENDKQESFPDYDNGDNALDRGIAPYLTVLAREPDTALDNKPRISLTQDAASVTAQIETTFTPEEQEICQDAIKFILQLKGQNFDFSQLNSVAELYREGLEPTGDATTPDPLVASPITLEQLPYILDRFSVPRPQQQSGQEQQEQQEQQQQQEQEQQEQGQQEQQGQEQEQGQQEETHQPGPSELQPRTQEPKQPANPTGDQQRDNRGDQAKPPRDEDSSSDNVNQKAGGRRQAIKPGEEGELEGGELESGELESGSLEEQLQGQLQGQGQSQSQGISGLININTAPRRVLALLPGISPEAVEAIINGRGALTQEAARTPAWLIAAGIDTATFHAIAPYVTTKSYQYRVEVLGYADHNRVMKRCEWLLEMVGPVAQVRYFRDLTGLGIAWPIDDETIAGNSVQPEEGGG